MSIKEYRLGILADLLLDMEAVQALPLPDSLEVGNMMVDYFYQNGYEKDLEDKKSTWRPTAEYCAARLADTGAVLRKMGKHFDFHRYWDKERLGLRGEWKFLTKREEREVLKMEEKSSLTRATTYNSKLDDSKYKHDLPHLAEVPLLE